MQNGRCGHLLILLLCVCAPFCARCPASLSAYPTRSFLRRNAAVSAIKSFRATPRTVSKCRAKFIPKATRLAGISNACLAPKTRLAQPLRGASGSDEGRVVSTFLPDHFVVFGHCCGGDGARGGCVGDAYASDGVVPLANLREQEHASRKLARFIYFVLSILLKGCQH